VRIPIGPEFVAERQRYDLRFCCEDCAYLTAEGSCAHGWPQEEHRAAYYEGPRETLTFCKEFELA